MSVSTRSISETSGSDGRFDRLTSSIRGSVEELIQPSSEPDPQGHTHASTEVYRIGYDVNRPDDDDLQQYWTTYKQNPVVRRMISNFASEVVEPGWFITADNDETEEELTEFMEQVGIIDGNVNENFIELAEQLVIQYEVRGTALIEKVKDDEGRYTALNPLNPETFEIYTKPGAAILVAPDDNDLDGDVKMTDDNKVAAYVQFDDRHDVWRDRKEKRFARDEMIKLTRDADVGEVFGNSLIEPIQDRSEALREKLQNNDDAIATKAWPIVIFQGGSEEEPWSLEEMQGFMENLDSENLEPGTMIGTGGDMSIEEFSGEVADIGDSLDFDLNWNISAMPGPSYAIGGFEENVSKSVAQQQAAEFRKEIRKMRRDIENAFTPFLKEVANQHDLDDADSVQLHVTRPDGMVPPEDVSGNIIRYQSDSPQGDGSGGQSLPGNNSSQGDAGEDNDGQTFRGSPRQVKQSSRQTEENSQPLSVWEADDELASNA